MTGRTIERARRARGLTRTALAALVGCTRQHVHAIETGRRDPSVALLGAICRELGLAMVAEQ